MAITRKEEARALSADERELVDETHHPALQALSDQDLSKLIALVRERRDRAQAQANQRRREMRGKGAPKGATHSSADEGSKLKLSVLAMAMRRLNNERERRRRMAAAVSQADNSRKALAMKRAAQEEGNPGHNTRHAHQGMRNAASRKRENLIRPMERGRQRKAASVAQAKRDAR